MRRTILALGFLLGCGPPKPPVPVDGWAVARAALLDGSSCYAERAQYCIREPDFVDSAIQQALDWRSEGKMPEYDKDVESIISSAKSKYRESCRAPVGLAKIERIVAAYYAEPTVDDALVAGVVNVDVGALPGKLTLSGRSNEISLRESDLIEHFWWKASEAGRVLAKYAAAHPNAKVIRAQVHLGRGGSDKDWVYRYFRSENVVVVGELDSKSIYVSDPIDGGLEAMAAGRLALEREQMSFCSGAQTQDEAPRPGFCPWEDAYGEVAKELRHKAELERRRR